MTDAKKDSISRYYVSRVLADGNCLFKCISFTVYDTFKKYDKVRDEIVCYIANHWNEYANYINCNYKCKSASEYVEYMSQQGVYASECEIYAAHELYYLKIHICDKNTPGRLKSYGHDGNPIFLLICGGISLPHFDLLLPYSMAMPSSLETVVICTYIKNGKVEYHYKKEIDLTSEEKEKLLRKLASAGERKLSRLSKKRKDTKREEKIKNICKKIMAGRIKPEEDDKCSSPKNNAVENNEEEQLDNSNSNATEILPRRRGPYCYKIEGQIFHDILCTASKSRLYH